MRSTTTTYTYEGLSLLALAAQRSDGATWSIDYLVDSASRPYAAIYAASDAAPMVVGMVTTARGDVAELVDETGAAFALYRTDAFGAPVEVSSYAAGSVPATLAAAIASRNPVRYAGYCFDEHSGLYYLSQRYYDPASRQFLSKDPARADGEESAYQYCGGDPVGKVDPSGEYLIPSWVNVGGNGHNCVRVAVRGVVGAIRGKMPTWGSLSWVLGGTPYFPLPVLNCTSLRVMHRVSSWYVNRRATWDECKNEIASNRPVIAYGEVKVNNGPWGWHTFAFYGWRVDASGANQLAVWSWDWGAWVTFSRLDSADGASCRMNGATVRFRRSVNFTWWHFKRS